MGGILTVWVITWRIVGVAMLVALILPVVALAVRRRMPFPPARAFLLPLLPPLLIVAWSGAFWAAEERSRGGSHWVSHTLTALALGGVAALIATWVRYARSPRFWAVVIALIANLVFLLGAPS